MKIIKEASLSRTLSHMEKHDTGPGFSIEKYVFFKRQ